MKNTPPPPSHFHITLSSNPVSLNRLLTVLWAISFSFLCALTLSPIIGPMAFAQELTQTAHKPDKQSASLPNRSAAAHIISLQGQGYERQSMAMPWQSAVLQLPLQVGHQVKTGQLSKMGILFRDQSQIRLNQNSLLVIKDVLSQDSQRTHLRLQRGRAWTRSKNIPDQLIMETPSAVAAIRGTDWELDVDANGGSRLTVLHGEVEYYNDYGRIRVKQNEQAWAEPGKAPIKVFIQNPQQRVQWLRQYRMEAHRYWPEKLTTAQQLKAILYPKQQQQSLNPFEQALWLILQQQFYAAQSLLLQEQHKPDTTADSWLLLADLQTYSGQFQQAYSTLQQGHQHYPQEARFPARLGQVALLLDQPQQAKQWITMGLEQHKDSIENLLALAEWATWQGDFVLAKQTYTRLVTLAPEEDRAWYGMGKILNEREDYLPARQFLHKAIELAPDGVGYQGELATLETFSHHFTQAQTTFEQALRDNPSDYVALTAQGLLFLKQGKLDQAIENFLKATLIEPRFARAHAFLAIAYYQQRRTELALHHLTLHQELDDKDPLAYLLQTRINADQYQPAAAIQSARQALKRLPYLKSLNQLANDQQGASHIGSALADFGLFEWADAYAQQSYAADRADSHFFLAEQYRGNYKKTSELIQGFITDPSSFYAARRYDPLLLTPGHELSTGVLGIYNEKKVRSNASQSSAEYDAEDEQQRGQYFMPWVQLSGYDNSILPLSYFLKREAAPYDSELSNINQQEFDSDNISLGIGLKPQEQVNLFAFLKQQKYAYETEMEIDHRINHSDYNYHSHTELDLDGDGLAKRLDLGMEYQLPEHSRLWIKTGTGRQTIDQQQLTINHTETRYSDPVNDYIATYIDDSKYDSETRGKDLQLRYLFRLNSQARFNWGAEFSQLKQDIQIRQQTPQIISPGAETTAATHHYHQLKNRNRHYSLYLAGEYQMMPQLKIDWGLFFNHFATDYKTTYTVDTPQQSNNHSALYPRIGFAYQWNPQHTFRYAYQEWLKPAAEYSLGPLTTAGISLDERFVGRGDEYQRHFIQWEWQSNPQTFIYAFAEWEKVKSHHPNGQIISAENQLELQSIRQNFFDLNQRSTLELLQNHLNIEAGHLYAGGIALNQIINPQLSARIKYVNSHSQLRDAQNHGQPFPYTPRHELTSDLTWIHPQGTHIKGQLQYLSQLSYGDLDFDPGWSWNITAEQELLHRQIWLYGHIRHNHVTEENSYYMGLEYRL